MKVFYKETIFEKILKTVQDAELHMKQIDYIELDEKEWDEVSSRLLYDQKMYEGVLEKLPVSASPFVAPKTPRPKFRETAMLFGVKVKGPIR